MARPRKIDQIASNSDLVCDDPVVHIESVRRARASAIPSANLAELTSFFSVIADPTRLRIIAALDTTELCVCDLAAAITLSESAVSHHLRSMRDLGLVKTRRDGRLVFYSLDDDHVTLVFRQALEHTSHRLSAPRP